MLFEEVSGMTCEEKFKDRKIDVDCFRIRKHACHDEQVREDNAFDPAAESHEFVLRPAYLLDASLTVKRDLKQGGVLTTSE